MSISLTQPAIGSTGWGTAVNANWQAITDAFQTAAPFTGTLSVAPTAVSSGTQTAVTITAAPNTGLTLSTEVIDVNFNLARTVQWATGALATQRAVAFQAPTYGFVGASTISNAATVAITAAPTAGTNATITNRWAFWVQADNVRFDGRLFAGGLTIPASTFAGNILWGVQNGTTALAGQIGEVALVSNTTLTNTAATSTWLQMSSITLTAGDWIISASVLFWRNTATWAGAAQLAISTTSASVAGAIGGYTYMVFDSGGLAIQQIPIYVPCYRVNISTGTTYYLNVMALFSSGQPQINGCSILATRIR